MGFGKRWGTGKPAGDTTRVKGANRKILGAVKVNEWGEPIIQRDAEGNVTRTEKQYRELFPQALIFDSKFELLCYNYLKAWDVTIELKRTFEIVPGFTTPFETVLPITYTPDFVVCHGKLWIDSKGYANDTFPLIEKLTKKYFHDYSFPGRLMVVKNQKEMLAVLELVKKGAIDEAFLVLEEMRKERRKVNRKNKAAKKLALTKILSTA